jgi:hypothetical protein
MYYKYFLVRTPKYSQRVLLNNSTHASYLCLMVKNSYVAAAADMPRNPRDGYLKCATDEQNEAILRTVREAYLN